ncbi:hypothetical protein C7S15_2108 [Burkholderia cepacia]|nr:hypothetical protein [Burkholderia cepacia]
MADGKLTTLPQIKRALTPAMCLIRAFCGKTQVARSKPMPPALEKGKTTL